MKHPWDPHLFAQGARAAGRDATFIQAANDAATKIKAVHPDLPVVLSLSHLAHLVGVPASTLHDIVDRRSEPYRIFRLKKRSPPRPGAAPNRAYRTILVPSPTLMRTHRWIAQNILNTAAPHPASFAFAPGRSLTGAADRHAGCRWLVKMDVQNFFESIKEQSVFKVFLRFGYSSLLSFELARLCSWRTSGSFERAPDADGLTATLPYALRKQGHLPQGAPTSPMLANLAVYSMDQRLLGLAESLGWKYSRYADDLAFSTRAPCSRSQAMRLAALVRRELEVCGLKSNQAKTQIVPPGARRIVLGLQVDQSQPHLSRAFKNNVETHLFALTSNRIGPAAHRRKRGFASVVGMRRHIEGLIAFAHQVEPKYAQRLYEQFNSVDWSA
jgi:RNA-directed DNA polymerase